MEGHDAEVTPTLSPLEYLERMMELVRSGHSPESLAKSLSYGTVHSQLDPAGGPDAGRRQDGLTTDERSELQRLRRANETLREEQEILKKASLVRTGDRLDPVGGFFMKTHQAAHSIATLCRVLGVLRWRVPCVAASRPNCTAVTDQQLLDQIRIIHR